VSTTAVSELPAVEAYDMPAAAPEELRRQVEQFLHYEAQLLDEWKLPDWLKLITQDIDYRIPVRNTVDSMDIAKSFSTQAFHMVENYGSLAPRMQRFSMGTAWSEKPPSRVRRHVSNIRVSPLQGDEVAVRSNLLFFWGRDNREIIVSAERNDTLRLIQGRLYLAKRTILLDHVSLPLPNLSVVL
jgi:ethylbenzene dioxygenase beta subunit